METFWNDIVIQLKTYYSQLVALTPKFLLAIVVMVIAFTIARWSKNFARKRLSRNTDDPLLANFLAKLVRLTLILIGLLIVLRLIGLGDAAASLLAGAGISAFILGFAFKDIGENFLAGILMAFKRPFRVGDVIETGGIQGKIIGLSLRDTQIKTFDGKDVYVPNGMLLKNPLINYTIDGFLRQEFGIGVDYESDLNEVIKIIYNAMKKVDGILWDEGKAPNVVIKELGTSTVNFTIYHWIDTFDKKVSGLAVKTNAMKTVLADLTAAGFYMPADIIELKNYNMQSLSTGEK